MEAQGHEQPAWHWIEVALLVTALVTFLVVALVDSRGADAHDRSSNATQLRP